MRRSYLLLVAAVGLALLAIVYAVLPRNAHPAMAAPDTASDPFKKLPSGLYEPLYQGEAIDCTLTYTTTDSLNNRNACAVDESVAYCAENVATTLASYDDLALVDETGVPDGEEREVPVHDDWFRLDNADENAIYTVQAVPNRTRNYNFGIIVYDLDYTQVVSDVDALDNSAEVNFQAENAGPYFFRVFQRTADCTGRTYDLNASKVEPTATPTSTPLPSAGKDPYEDNNRFGEAPTLPIQVPILLELTFHSTDDVDYFLFYTKKDRWYQATTSELTLVDTLLEVYAEDQTTRFARDDDGAGGLASQATWQSDRDGYFYVVVRNNVVSSGSYNLTLAEINAPTPGTPTVGPTPRAQADDCEANPSFEHACVIPVNESQTFNFIPAFGEGPDNDFFKIWIKSGLHFRCETSNLSPGLDPNMIIFSGPSWDHAIAGNDDFEEGNYNSALNYYATYDGWLYVLVGTGDRTPPDVLNSSYTLRCEKSTKSFSATPVPSPTATEEAGTATPTCTPTPTTSGSPLPTPTTGSQALIIRSLATPTPAASATPATRFVPIRLLVYYDGNGDLRPGAGEGIAGLSAQVYEVASNELLAQGYTGEQGDLEFTVSARGPSRISIPFLGFSQLITGPEANIQVRVPPHSPSGGTP